MAKVKSGLPLVDVALEAGAELAGSKIEDRPFDLNEVLGGLLVSEPVAADELTSLLDEKRADVFAALDEIPDELMSPKMIERTVLDTGISGEDAEELYDDAITVWESRKPSTIKEAKKITERAKIDIEGEPPSFKDLSKNPSAFNRIKNVAKKIGTAGKWALGAGVLYSIGATLLNKSDKDDRDDRPRREERGKTRTKALSVEEIQKIYNDLYGGK